MLDIGAMSSSGRDNNEASQKKKLSGTHSNFKLEWLRDPDLKGQLQKKTGNEDLSIANAARSPPEMQTTPRHCDIIILTSTKINKQGYSMPGVAKRRLFEPLQAAL